MKIAQIAPIAERVPPKKYGGTERVVYALTEELVKRGHQVTLFASGDSITSANLQSVFPISLREGKVKNPYGINELTLLNIGEAYKRQSEFDVIHDHNSPISLPVANLSETPVLLTIHSPLTQLNVPMFQSLKKPYLVSISEAQIKEAEKMNFIGTVHNGLNFSKFPFGNGEGKFLLYVGRISPEKGVHLAMDAAWELKMPLVIAAKIDDFDENYFYKFIKPRLKRKNVEWLGEKEEEERNKLYCQAIAFLHPVVWPEPFGLTMIEAMACGCPVIAMNRGSVPELIVPGKTGFIANSFKEMVESIRNVAKIKREAARRHALENFNEKRMTDSYETLYKKIAQLSLAKKKIAVYGKGFG